MVSSKQIKPSRPRFPISKRSQTAIFDDSETVFVNYESAGLEKLPHNAMRPRCYSSSHDLLERGAERAIAAVAALERELLGGDFTTGNSCLLVQADKVTDAKAVNVRVIRDALLCEMVTQISPVCTDDAGELGQSKVVL